MTDDPTDDLIDDLIDGSPNAPATPATPARGSRCLTFGMRLAALEAGRDPLKWPEDDDTATATSTTIGTAPATDSASGER